MFSSANIVMNEADSPISVPVFDPVLLSQDLVGCKAAAAQIDGSTGRVEVSARLQVTVDFSLSFGGSSHLRNDQVLPSGARNETR